MNRRLIPMISGIALLAVALLIAGYWFTFRIYVPEDQCAVLIRKMGDSLPPGQRVATQSGQKGIQEQVLGPGRYFYNPLVWDHELVDLTEIPSGDPGTWEWVNTLSDRQRSELQAGNFRFKGEFPQIGVVTRKIGKTRTTPDVIVTRASGEEGILREVLTPGVYKLNPYVYEVETYPAVVIPAGFVGVVTNMFGNLPERAYLRTTDTAPADTNPAAGIPAETVSADSAAIDTVSTDLQTDDPDTGSETSYIRPLALPGQRGTMRNILQPGVYFINPKLQKVTLIEIGFNEFSQVKISDAENYRISFPSDTGFLIKVGVTVIWGIHPDHAAEIINEFGNVDGVLSKVINPQLRSICRNTGSNYAARDFIQGEMREQFQQEMTRELQQVCRKKNIEILLALVREIEVHEPGAIGGDRAEVTEDLKRTIQQSYIAIENQLTKEKQREAAIVKAKLEEERKKIDIAREQITAETRKLVAEINAEAQKEAAQIEAQGQLEVATIQQQVAKLDAQQIEIIGQANADVEKMKNNAEAEGYKMLVQAFGSPRAYNLYTFAERFEPQSIRLFFAGEGTFWTDLSRFEEVGAARLLETPAQPKPPEPEKTSTAQK